MEDIKKLNEFIRMVDSFRVVKNCDQWDWQRNTLLNQSLNKTKPKIK